MALIQTIYAYTSLTINIARAFLNLLYGLWYISKLNHTPITIFAGNNLEKNCEIIKKAEFLAQKFLQKNVPVLSAGCPGIMQLKDCNLHKYSSMASVVISYPKKNRIINKHLIIYRFFARKWLLISTSKAFVIFPGGLGTMSELTQLLTLIQTKMRPQAPIILFDSKFWQPFVTWLDNYALRDGLISKAESQLFSVTDDIESIYKGLVDI